VGIKGYRALSPEEIALINEVKALADVVGDKLEDIYLMENTDKRWAAIAKADLQTGFMALIRSIARPESF
jgi:hypothetical protein